MYPQNLRVSKEFSTSFGLHNIIETSTVIGTETKNTSLAASTIIHVNRLKKHENSSCRRLPPDPHGNERFYRITGVPSARHLLEWHYSFQLNHISEASNRCFGVHQKVWDMDGLEVLEKVFTQKLKKKVILLTMHKEMSASKNVGQMLVELLK